MMNRVKLDEDGKICEFDRGIIFFCINRDCKDTLKSIRSDLINNKDHDLKTEILIILGEDECGQETKAARMEFLIEHLASTNPHCRYGAILGLSRMNDRLAINAINAAVEVEINPNIKHIMDKVVKQLEK